MWVKRRSSDYDWERNPEKMHVEEWAKNKCLKDFIKLLRVYKPQPLQAADEVFGKGLMNVKRGMLNGALTCLL